MSANPYHSTIGSLFSVQAAPVWLLAQLSDGERAKHHFHLGKDYYDREEYEAALDEFKKSHQLSQKPELQYNIARTLEKLERYSEAIVAYQLYLKQSPEAPDRGFIESQIALLEKMVEAQERKTVKQEIPSPPPVPPAAVEKDVPRVREKDIYIPPPPKKKRTEKDARREGRSWYFPLAAGSLGLAALSLVVGLISKEKAEDVEAADSGNNLVATRNRKKTLERLAKIGYIGAGVFAFGAVFFLGLDNQRKTSLNVVPHERGANVFFRISY